MQKTITVKVQAENLSALALFTHVATQFWFNILNLMTDRFVLPPKGYIILKFSSDFIPSIFYTIKKHTL
ncbi:hypothetical protein CCP3SC5AM1_20041 [Gammaproteobacteria bacterium]